MAPGGKSPHAESNAASVAHAEATSARSWSSGTTRHARPISTAVGGSILRDLLLSVPIALMQVGSLYAVAALVGATSLVVLAALGVPAIVAAVVCVALTFVVRVLAVLFHWTLPEQRPLRRATRGRPGTTD